MNERHCLAAEVSDKIILIARAAPAVTFFPFFKFCDINSIVLRFEYVLRRNMIN